MCQHNRFLRVLSSTVAALALSAATAHAALIPLTIGDFSGSAAVVDFTVASTRPLPYSEDGATFVSYTGQSMVFNGALNDFLLLIGSGTLRVTFSDPAIRAGFSLFAPISSPALITAEAFADLQGTQSLGSLTLGNFAPDQRGFVGFQSDAPFARADITFAVSSAQASFSIDDFRFQGPPATIPEPATLMLGLLGAGSFGARALGRRRARR